MTDSGAVVCIGSDTCFEYIQKTDRRMPFMSSMEGRFGFGRASAGAAMLLAGSLLFNGTTAYLTASPGITLGSGAYTIECWFYNNSDWPTGPNIRGLLGGGPSGPSGVAGCMSLFFPNNTTVQTDSYGGLGTVVYTVAPITLNAWHHFALVRNASNIETVFIDGVKATSGQQTNIINYSGPSKDIAKYYGGQWAGYITNMRIVVGTAMYDPTAASITIPTAPLTSVVNTKYLMLGAEVTTDSSSTQTITNTDVIQSAVKPF